MTIFTADIMCGFTGFIDYDHRSTREQLAAMTGTLHHRGPDDDGIELFKMDAASVGIGFRRLSIIDLSPTGHQPMQDTQSGCWIVFNGEIYNYQEIRQELKNLGHTFISASDTEVILKAYHQWGIDCISRFRGMFAIGLMDQRKNLVYLIRDRAGVKPLYYYRHGSLMLFGSELKSFHRHAAFKKELDTDALSLYFRFGYIPAPYSIFKNTFKLRPGNYLKIDLTSQSVEEVCYWNAFDAYNVPRRDITYKDAVVRTEEVLRESFRLRMVADVPVGVFLSGGYDSTCVAAILQKDAAMPLKTYTIGFEEKKFNEADHARQVAAHLATDHQEHICTPSDAMEIIPVLPEIYDEPFGDSSAVPTILVSRFARRHVKVALSADAGDELFAGYPRHAKNLRYLRSMGLVSGSLGKAMAAMMPPFSTPIEKPDRYGKLREFLANSDTIKRFCTINETYTFDETRRLMGRTLTSLPTVFDQGPLLDGNNDDLSRILATEYRTYLVEDILKKVDMATMSAGLEGREPFLDHKVLEWAAALPSSFKYKDGVQKRILKDIVHKYVPKQLMERPKMGFGVPLVKWMRSELRELLDEVMEESFIGSTQVLDPAEVLRIKKAYLEGRLENFERLWFIYVFLAWYKHWMTQASN